MSDLISRNKVVSILNQLEEHSLSGKMDISNAIYLINNQPIAYDVDNVVEQLKEFADESYKAYCIAFNSDDRAEYDAYTNTIGIVKGGGK